MNTNSHQKNQEIVAEFNKLKSWEERTRLLLQWGNTLIPLTNQERTEEHQVSGCEAKTWFIVDQFKPTVLLRADSESKLLRGMLALLLARINGLTKAEIAEVSVFEWFQDLGLARQLTPSRTNGLLSVLAHLEQTIR